MNKVKIMLMSALVVAAVGGALAFKAQKSQGLYCGSAIDFCPDKTDNLYTTQGATQANHIPDIYCSEVKNGDCTFVINEP